VLEWWRPGGSDLAIIGQGLQAYLSLPPRCVGVSYHKASQQGSSQSQAFREDERDGSGNDASRGKSHHSLASERSSGDGCTDGRESLGQVDGAQGVLIQPE